MNLHRILPLSLLLPLVIIAPAQTSTEADAPSVAPLPANGSVAPQWESLNLPDQSANQAPAEMLGPRIESQPRSCNPAPQQQAMPSIPQLRMQDPFAMMEHQRRVFDQMQREMEAMINQQLQPHIQQGMNIHGLNANSAELEDCGDHYAIEMTIDGLDCATPRISVTGQRLMLECQQTQCVEKTTPDGTAVSSSTFTNNIRQAWTLPADADTQNISANRDGDKIVITVQRQQTREIEIPLISSSDTH